MFKERIGALWYELARLCCWLFTVIFFRLRVYGVENIPSTGAFLVVSNHQSFLDPLFCGAPIRRSVYYLARDTLFRNPFFSRLIASVHASPVRKDSADVKSIKFMIEKLKAGNGVCLFPEGTRCTDGKVGPFKSGMGLLSRRGKAMIVPALIDGAFECWPRHRKWPSLGRVTVCYGPAIPVEEAAGIPDKELADQLTRIIRGMQDQLRSRLGKEPLHYDLKKEEPEAVLDMDNVIGAGI